MFKQAIIKSVICGAVCGSLLAIGIGINYLLKTSDLFTVKTVEVRGVQRTDREMLKAIYQPLVGRNIFQEISPSTLLTDDPWVVRLEMKRVVPDKLLVIVEEETELITFKQGVNCTALTAFDHRIPVDCQSVRVSVAEFPLPEEFIEFTGIYGRSEFLQECDIILRNGFFTATGPYGTFLGSYMPGVFEENMDAYLHSISKRYKSVDTVNLTVRGKVFVKGVTNG